MKKLLYILWFIPMAVWAQTGTENYVKNTIFKVRTTDGNTSAANAAALTHDQKAERITYYDGLGRPVQNIAKQAGGNKEDIIIHTTYDAYGRQIKQYLPYAKGSNNENIRSGDMSVAINAFYKSKYPEDFTGMAPAEVNAYSEKVFDNSPLNLILEQAAPGKDWKVGNGHTIAYDYSTNSAHEVLRFGVQVNAGTASPELVIATGYYPAGEGYKTITKDENWRASDGKDRTTEEFKDLMGRVLLKRTYNNQQLHDTYYVYDDFGNLTYVLPPLASAKTNVYQTGMQSYTAGTFLTGGSPTGTVTFGIEQTAPGTFEFVADFDLQNLANSTFKTGYIMDLPHTHPAMGSHTYLGGASVSESSGGVFAYRYVSYYARDGKLYAYGGGYSSNGVNTLVISDFDRTTRVSLPQNLPLD